MSFHVPNKFRIRTGRMASADSLGNNGGFFVPNPCQSAGQRRPTGPLRVIASDGSLVPEESPELAGWEHVSVSLPDRCPTWTEMAFIKGIFWDEDDCVVQFHPPRSEYVNNHPFCLHLWRRIDGPFPMPPAVLVGIASIGRIV